MRRTRGRSHPWARRSAVPRAPRPAVAGSVHHCSTHEFSFGHHGWVWAGCSRAAVIVHRGQASERLAGPFGRPPPDGDCARGRRWRARRPGDALCRAARRQAGRGGLPPGWAPPIIGEIVAGVLIGPSVLGLVEPDAVLEVFSELGVVFLLFVSDWSRACPTCAPWGSRPAGGTARRARAVRGWLCARGGARGGTGGQPFSRGGVHGDQRGDHLRRVGGLGRRGTRLDAHHLGEQRLLTTSSRSCCCRSSSGSRVTASASRAWACC